MAFKIKQQSSDSHWFLFILFPFFAAITALKSYKSVWAKNVVWAFVVFFGLTFAIAKENILADSESDIIRYVEGLKDLYNHEFTIASAVNFFKDSGEIDILQTTIIMLLSRFTDSQVALTMVYGFIFGFFFSRNIWYLFEKFNGTLKNNTILLMAVFILVNPFWHINGFRFNTAVHIFIYGLLPYLYEGKKKGIIICCLTLLVHFSFLLPVCILLIYVFVGNRLNVYFWFFILSIFINNINVSELNEFIETNLPEAFVERSKTYRLEDTVDEFRQTEAGEAVITDTGWVQSKKNWYAEYYLTALYFSETVLLIFLFIFSRKIIRGNKWLMNCFCFSLLMFGVANIMNSVPSGSRFYMVASMAMLPVLMFYIQNKPQEDRMISRAILVLYPFLLIFCIVSLRTGLYSISVNTLVSNPILAIFTDVNLSINNLIK